MRYSISEDVSFEEATPRGLLTVAFPKGEIEPEDGSDAQYVIEYVLIPGGFATVVGATSPAPVDPPENDEKPEDAPDAPDAAKE